MQRNFDEAWGGIIIVGGAARFQGLAVPTGQFPLVMLAMLLGPSTAGLVMMAITGGRAGLRDLGARMRCWRVAHAGIPWPCSRTPW